MMDKSIRLPYERRSERENESAKVNGAKLKVNKQIKQSAEYRGHQNAILDLNTSRFNVTIPCGAKTQHIDRGEGKQTGDKIAHWQ